MSNVMKEHWVVREMPTQIGRCFAVGLSEHIERGHGYFTLYDDATSLNPFGDGEAEERARLISAAPDMFAAIDAADTAFAVLSVQDLGGQSRQCIREAWPLVQSARAKALPDSGYADAVKEAQQHEIARLDGVVKQLVDAVLYLYPRAHVHLADPAELQKIMQLVKEVSCDEA